MLSIDYAYQSMVYTSKQFIKPSTRSISCEKLSIVETTATSPSMLTPTSDVKTRGHNCSGDIRKYSQASKRTCDDELTAWSPKPCMLGHITRLDTWQYQPQREGVTSNRAVNIGIVTFPFVCSQQNNMIITCKRMNGKLSDHQRHANEINKCPFLRGT